MGYLWDPGNKKVREVMKVAEKAILKSTNGKKGGDSGSNTFLAGFAMLHDGPNDLRVRGYHMILGAIDVGLFRNAAVKDVKKFKMSLDEGLSDDEDNNDSDAKGEKGEDGDEKYWSE